MIKKVMKRFGRAPVSAIAILLFAVVVSIIICALQVSSEAYLREQQEAYRTIPVEVTVQAVTGENGRECAISSWTIDLFTGKNSVEIMDKSSENRETTLISLSGYLEDVRIKMSRRITKINGSSPIYQTTPPLLIGITSIPSDEQLLPENGCEITWYDGYDESVFGGEELVCLVPESKSEAYDNGDGATNVYFGYTWGRMDGDTYVEVGRLEYERTLKIVGTYSAGDLINIYCPFSIIEQVYSGLEENPMPDSISATLTDNLLLDEFREKASFLYSNLSENSQNSFDGISVRNRSKTYTFDNSSNALIIDNSDLIDFMSALEAHNAKFNRIVTLATVAFSVVAGFLIGFLMIRLRKRDIMLMQADAKSRSKIYFGFVLEQFFCIILGIALGGACYLWKPIEKLLIFAVVYFAVSCLVLLLFMLKKHPMTVKEDEQ